jgi:hypothetical protein
MTELTLAACQRNAETALRQAVRERSYQLRPPDAGLVQVVNDAVAAAHKLGKQEAALVLAQAWQLFLDNDDLEVMRDTLTDLLPADYAAPEPALGLPPGGEDPDA